MHPRRQSRRRPAAHLTLAAAALLAALAGLEVSGARAEYFETGRDLYQKCRTPGTAAQVFCFGFIIGIADVMEDNPLDGRSACIPRDASIQQVTEVVIGFLERNPDIRDFTGESLAVQALSDKFPCAKPKGKR
jgi:hypothetical protein